MGLLGVLCGGVSSYYYDQAPVHHAPTSLQVYKPDSHVLHQASPQISGIRKEAVEARTYERSCRCDVDQSCRWYGQCSNCACPAFEAVLPRTILWLNCTCHTLVFNHNYQLMYEEDCWCRN